MVCGNIHLHSITGDSKSKVEWASLTPLLLTVVPAIRLTHHILSVVLLS
jgi:hypothetical protein